MPKLVVTSASGKLGGAVLQNLLKYNLVPPHEIVVSTSSSPSSQHWDPFKARGVQVRQASYDDPDSMRAAFAGSERLLLVSTPRISMDFDDAPYGQGREAHHFAAVQAARSAGIKHIYYTSLGFKSNSKSGVMRAHNRTEEFLQMLTDTGFTIIREGLYNESWPLYLGHFHELPTEGRSEVVLAGDGNISWAAIDDLGLGTAMILADEPSRYSGITLSLSTTNNAHSLGEIAAMVSSARGDGSQLTVKKVGRQEHERYYIERGLEPSYIRWWAKTYDAIVDGEAENKDPTLEKLLEKHGRVPKPLEQTIREMVGQQTNSSHN
ncbi:hypothetical protein IWX49DRAFT_332708 [Phyllosticta citricarpa]|uniref:NmrA-like domain-containing protein n=2 Tax=Phyllosticta TaxID=121621 RepID=A0ABR1L714_9PEZI